MVHWFDIFAVTLLLISSAWSCFRGFVREAFALVSLIAGYVVASMFSGALAPYFKAIVDQKHYQEMASFLFLFIVSAILIDVLGLLVRRSLQISDAFGLVDRIAGLGAGIAKGTLILALLVYPLAFFPGLQKDIVGKSRTAPELMEISEYIMAVLAPGFTSSMEKAGRKSKSLKAKAKTIEKYRKQIEEAKTGIKDKAERIKNRLKLATEGGVESRGEPEKEAKPESEINESDRKELDQLIKKLE